MKKAGENLLTAGGGHGIIQKLSAREAHGSAVFEEQAPDFEPRGEKKGLTKRRQRDIIKGTARCRTDLEN